MLNPMMNNQTQSLLNQLQAGDEGVIQLLFKEHYSYLCKSVYRYVKDGSTTEDIVQNVFMKLWTKRESINVKTSFKPYLRRMAINEAISYLRGLKRYSEPDLIPEAMTDANDNVERQYLQSELSEQVRNAIDSLPPKCRTVFLLSRYEELTYKEIAEKMEISPKTVENQMSKALKVLRVALKSYLAMLLLFLLM